MTSKSAGEILETSEDPELLVQGQTRPTVTKSKLFEVSLVDVGSNDDAIVLQKDGKKITLGKDSECPLPLLNNNNQNQKQMEQKMVAMQLGLPATATEAEINAKLDELKTAKEENERLQQKNAALTLASITAAVEKAVGEKRITPDKKDEFINLGKEGRPGEVGEYPLRHLPTNEAQFRHRTSRWGGDRAHYL